jgi:N-acetylneuraminate synthase
MEHPNITIAGQQIGINHSPYVIAEISANHNGKIENALKLVDEAKAAGASAVKLQTYRPDTITLDCSDKTFQISGGLWDGRTLYELYEEAHMPWDWHAPLFDHAREVGITIFSSPFDPTAIDLLEDLNAPAYKIASFEAVDLPLIRYAASTGKPLIISTGMANAEEITEAIEAAHEGGCKELAILHCVSGYPAPAEDYNLRTIPDMIERFGLVTGLSDHTLDNTTAITSVALGLPLSKNILRWTAPAADRTIVSVWNRSKWLHFATALTRLGLRLEKWTMAANPPNNQTPNSAARFISLKT